MSEPSKAFSRAMCVMVDVENYSKAADEAAQHEIQRELARILATAAADAQLQRVNWERQEQGDGELAIVPVGSQEPLVVDGFVRHLNRLLAQHNRTRRPESRLRVRIGIDTGAIQRAELGFTGKAPVSASRLVNAQAAKEAMQQATECHLALILAPKVFEEIIQEGFTTLDEKDFQRIQVKVKSYDEPAYMWIPGTGVTGLPTVKAPVAVQPAGVTNIVHGGANATEIIFGVRNG